MASSMGKIAVVGALGVGGYLLYRSMSSTTAAAAAGTSTTSTPFSLADLVNALKSSGAAAAPPATAAAPNPSGPTAKALVSAAGGVTSLNSDQWNYYWAKISGTTQTAELFPAGNRDALMTVGDYLAARQAAGLAVTLPGLSGMGAVAIHKPVVVIRGAEGRPVMVLSQGRRVILGGGW